MARMQVRKGLEGRDDIRGSEDGKTNRPYLILSGVNVHENGLFVAMLITHARERTERGDLREIGVVPSTVLDRGPHYLDARQLWTFPIEQDVAAVDSVGRLAPPSRESKVIQCLSDLLDAARRERSASTTVNREHPIAGQVVWLDLLGDAGAQQSDRFAIYRCLESAGHEWVADHTTRIACVVLVSAAAKRATSPATLPLITVIPLLNVPAFQGAHAGDQNPSITVPGRSLELSALTQLVLTVDYRGHLPFRRPRRVFYTDGALSTWLATSQEFEVVLREIQLLWGLTS